MKRIVFGCIVAASMLVSTPALAEKTTVRGVVQDALYNSGWTLSWTLDVDFHAAADEGNEGVTLGSSLRQALHPVVAEQRDITVLVCESYKSIIVHRGEGSEYDDMCSPLFSAADFVR